MNQEFNQNRIDNLLNDGYQFSPTDFISKAFAIVNKHAGIFIGFTLVYMIISSVLSNIEQALFGQVNISLLTTILQAILVPGYFIVARRINQQKSVEFKHFFEGSQKAANLIGVSILVRIISTLPFVPVIVSLFMNDSIMDQIVEFYAGLPQGEFNIPVISTMSILLFVLGIIGSLYVGIIYFFALPLACFTNLSIWDSMETSRKVASQNIFSILGLSLLQMLLMILGVLMLIIGIFYMMPVVLVATYVAFESVFKLEVEEDGIEITDHFVG